MDVKSVIVHGNFFCITVKELDLFKSAKAMGDILIVLIDSDEKISKKQKLLNSTEDKRRELVEELRCVDIVTVIDCTLVEVLETVNANILMIPRSTMLQEEYQETTKICEEKGIKVEIKW